MKKARKNTIKGIAEQLNVSVTTVSFVLNGKAKENKISDEMIKKVQAYVKEINYKPNQLAQSLRTGKSKIIVFMVEDISNLFFASIARIVEDLAYDKGYKVIFCSNENKPKRSKELISLFKERQVDGYIISPSPDIEEDIQSLLDEKIPVVLFDRYFPGLKTNYVVIDNEIASYNGTRHLNDNGYKKIGFITIDTEQNQMHSRLIGYQKAMLENNLEPKILKVSFEKNTQQDKKVLIKEFIGNNNLDAVYFSTNYLTQSGLEVLNENYPKLLNKIGILTFDDHDFFKIHTPSISAIAQPKREIAENLMRIMLQLLKKSNKEMPLEQVVLKTQLNPRQSSNRERK